jgi:amino acid permease
LTVTTIVKTVIGSGILGLPFTVSKCGYVFAIIVFAIATAVTQLGSVLLLKAKNLSGHSNFSTIFYHIYQNKVCKSLGSILIFCNNLGICTVKNIHRYPRNYHLQDYHPLSPQGNPPGECSA